MSIYCATPFKRRGPRTVAATSFGVIPNNICLAFYPVNSVTQSCPQSTLQASLQRELRARAPSSVAASVGKYKQEQLEVDHPIFNGHTLEQRDTLIVIYNKTLANLSANIYDSEDWRRKEIYSRKVCVGATLRNGTPAVTCSC